MMENAETMRIPPLAKALIGQKTGRKSAKTMHIPHKHKQAQGMLLGISLCLFMFCWA